MPLRRIPLALVVVLTMLAPDARAAGRLLADAAPAPAVADANTIAVMSSPGNVRLYDARGGELAALTIGDGCVRPPGGIGPIGGGQLMFDCSVARPSPVGGDATYEPRLLDVSTHETRIAAGASDAYYRALDEPLGAGYFIAVGAHGLLLRSSYYHGNTVDEGIDWRTGAHVAEPGAEAVLDIDSPSLVAPLCAPLARRPYDIAPSDTIDGLPAFDPFVYAPPYALESGPRSRLMLQRCGTTSARFVEADLGRRQVYDMRLVPGIATWRLWVLGRQPTRLRGYLIGCGVLLDWELRAGTQAAPTRHALVLSEPADDGRTWRVRRILLDGICERTRAAWQMTVANGPRSVHLPPRGATLRLSDRGATATLPDRISRLRHLAVRAGTSVRLLPGTGARAVLWRGEGGWRRLHAGPEGWSLPAAATRAPADLTFEVRYRGGGRARFEVHLLPRR